MVAVGVLAALESEDIAGRMMYGSGPAAGVVTRKKAGLEFFSWSYGWRLVRRASGFVLAGCRVRRFAECCQRAQFRPETAPGRTLRPLEWNSCTDM